MPLFFFFFCPKTQGLGPYLIGQMGLTHWVTALINSSKVNLLRTWAWNSAKLTNISLWCKYCKLSLFNFHELNLFPSSSRERFEILCRDEWINLSSRLAIGKAKTSDIQLKWLFQVQNENDLQHDPSHLLN